MPPTPDGPGPAATRTDDHRPWRPASGESARPNQGSLSPGTTAMGRGTQARRPELGRLEAARPHVRWHRCAARRPRSNPGDAVRMRNCSVSRILRGSRLIRPGKGKGAALKPCRVPYYPGPTGSALGSPSAAGCKTLRDSRTGCGGYAGVIASLIALTGRASRRTAAASWRSWPGAAPLRSMPRLRPGRHRPSGTGPQPGGRAVHRRLPLGRALEDPGHLGEQISPAPCKRAELSNRGGFEPAAGQVAPSGPVPRLARQLGDEDTVSFRALIDHAF